jgi:hypothetical protein
MASKTVWIASGIVVAIGVVAYVGFNGGSPAVNDGAGTIVQAKRAQTDGTNSFNPSSTTDERANTDSNGTSDQRGPQRSHDDGRNPDRAGDAAGHTPDRAGDAAGHTPDRAGDAANRAEDRRAGDNAGAAAKD